MATACRHPKVRIVSRHEDTEYVECLDCGEVFDSEEFRDMEIEDSRRTGTQHGRRLKRGAGTGRSYLPPWLLGAWAPTRLAAIQA